MADGPMEAPRPHRPDGPDGHVEHDLELIAALLDRDLPDADRAIAEARVAACRACAALHADLLALATATHELPTPVRTRDFALTPDRAAVLVRERAGEPVAVGTRLSREMTDARSRHATHDRLLVANLVDRSVTESERARGDAQLAACSACAELYDDLVALSLATRAMPVPTRPRDFTLTTADAERLRVRGWRRLLSAFGSPRDAFSRPLAMGLTTLGLAGLLVATIPAVLTGMGGAATALPTVGNAAGDAAGGAATEQERMAAEVSAAPGGETELGPAAIAGASPEASGAPAPAAVGPIASDDPAEQLDNVFVGGDSSPLAGEPDGAADLSATSLAPDENAGRLATVIVASLLLLLGLGLFTLRWISRRAEDR